MKPTIADTAPRFSLEMLDAAKRRAAQLREAAVNQTIDAAIDGPAALLRAVWRRLAGKEVVSCRS